MKKLLTTSKDRAAALLSKVDPEAVEYVKEYKDTIDNLTVLESDGYDFVEVDPSDEIKAIRHQQVMFGIDEGIIDDLAEFEMIYEALCILED